MFFGKSRANKMRRVTKDLEMSYTREVPFFEFEHLNVFSLFQKRRRKRLRNVLSVRDTFLEVDLDIFDFSYRTEKRRRRQTVLVIQAPRLDLPEFVMRPTHVGDQLAELFVNIDIDFDLWPRFSKNYVVKGREEYAIRYLMNDPFLEFFNSRPGWYIEGLKDVFILCKRRKRFKPQDIPMLHDFGLQIHRMLSEGGARGFV